MHETTFTINNDTVMSPIPTIDQQHKVYTVIPIVTILFPTLFNLIHV